MPEGNSLIEQNSNTVLTSAKRMIKVAADVTTASVQKATQEINEALNGKEQRSKDPHLKLTLAELQPMYLEAFSFLAKRTGHVEIVDSNSTLLKVYFPTPVLAQYLSK